MLYITETKELSFSAYDIRYRNFCKAIAPAKDLWLAHVSIEREGTQDPDLAQAFTWERTHLSSQWYPFTEDNDVVKQALDNLSPALQEQVQAFFDSVPTHKDRTLHSTLDRTLTWDAPFLSGDTLLLESMIRVHFSPRQPMKKWYSLDMEWGVGKYREDIATVKKSENEQNEQFDISDALRHTSIGAVKGFLKDVDAQYALAHPVPREVYTYLDELAALRAE